MRHNSYGYCFSELEETKLQLNLIWLPIQCAGQQNAGITNVFFPIHFGRWSCEIFYNQKSLIMLRSSGIHNKYNCYSLTNSLQVWTTAYKTSPTSIAVVSFLGAWLWREAQKGAGAVSVDDAATISGPGAALFCDSRRFLALSGPPSIIPTFLPVALVQPESSVPEPSFSFSSLFTEGLLIVCADDSTRRAQLPSKPHSKETASSQKEIPK